MLSLERMLLGKLKHLKNQHQVLVGLPRNAAPYPDGTSLVKVAIWNEFGTVKIPERSFARASVYRNRQKYHGLFYKAALKIIEGKDEMVELGKIGLIAAQDMQKQIDDTYFPPNAPYTIWKKGSSHPLIDTGHLRASITYKLRKRHK